MTNDENSPVDECKGRKNVMGHASEGLYGVGFIGAAVYFIQHADSFGAGVIGFLKALVWPAVLVYKLLEFLKL